ncbi:MAG: hypothetical protein GTN73_06245 [Candidatus Aminicenantes bacterium]|nr:hypothetical protein [Candidatus Aminicenantes bacterium]
MKESGSKYFQSIALHFFKHRGAPFFLSSKELDYIAGWEKMGIPLHVVLEGIERSFEIYRRKPGKKAKIHSLAFCDLQVLKAFEQDRERKVGHKQRIVERHEKRYRAKAEVERFLARIPHQISYLKEAYSQAQKLLSQSHFDEEKLERLERKIEQLLWKNSLDEEKEGVKSGVLKDYEFKQEEEFERIFKIKLIKVLRDKYKIPYISLFYY